MDQLEREMELYKSVLSEFLSPLAHNELESFVTLFEKIANP